MSWRADRWLDVRSCRAPRGAPPAPRIASDRKELPMTSRLASSRLVLARPARLGLSALLSFSLLTLPVNAARACTSVLLPAQDGGFVYGRTLEFGLQIELAAHDRASQSHHHGDRPGRQRRQGRPDLDDEICRHRCKRAGPAGLPRRHQRERPDRRVVQFPRLRGFPDRASGQGRPVDRLVRAAHLHPDQFRHRR